MKHRLRQSEVGVVADVEVALAEGGVVGAAAGWPWIALAFRRAGATP